MRRLAEAALAVLMALAAAAGPSFAASDQMSKPQGMMVADGAADQFKEGAHRVGEGAQRIGEGIKQGAIEAWDAAKAGAAAVSAKLNGQSSKSSKPAAASSADRH